MTNDLSIQRIRQQMEKLRKQLEKEVLYHDNKLDNTKIQTISETLDVLIVLYMKLNVERP